MFIIFAAVVVLFSISNTANVDILLNPLGLGVTMPLYLAILIVAFVSFIVGAITAYVFGFKHKQMLKHKDKQIAELERQLKQRKN